MKLSRMMSVSVTALAVSILAVGPAAAATGDSMSIGGGKLIAKGAAVQLSVTVTCAPYDDYWNPGQLISEATAQVSITQAVKKGQITSGYAEASVVCDSTPHTTSVLIGASTWAFQHGQAIVSGQLSNIYMSPPVLATVPTTVINIR